MVDLSRLDRLLRPRTVAVFGGNYAQESIRQCHKIGFAGEIWPVHPTMEEVEGLKVYRGVDDLPSAPDVAFIGVNRNVAIELMGQLSRAGTGGAVCFASGFAELGPEGAGLQARLVEAAGDMPFIGPNCHGLINLLDGVALWPDQHGGARAERGVALITQSGNIGLNLTMQRRGLPLAYLVTLGNQASVGLSTMIEALVRDERVTAIGLHVEGVDDPAAFARACAEAQRRGVPVVALKTGRSAAGAEITVSHTASLAGADAVADAFFGRVGVVRVPSIPTLLETLKVLHVHGALPGRDIASLSCSGGEAALIADMAEIYGLNFRRFTPAQKAAIEATVTELVTVSNPFDYHTYAWGNEAVLTEVFTATMQAGFDETLVILDFPRTDRCDMAGWNTTIRAMVTASRRTGSRAGVVATLPEAMPEDRAQAIIAEGLVPLAGIDDALVALAGAAHAGVLAARPVRTELLPLAASGGTSRTLSEWEGKRRLAGHGLTVPEGRFVAPGEDAGAAAEALGFPVALKAVGSTIAHKTEIGAVKLNLRSAEAVASAAAELAGIGEGLLVERMVPDAVAELIVGVNRDPVFGLYLVIGAGGQLVELIGDSRIVLMPASREEIVDAVLSLKSAKLLTGYRNRPAGDVEAVADAVLAIQAFASEEAAHLAELDVNPLMVRPVGHGAVAADVLIRLNEGAKP